MIHHTVLNSMYNRSTSAYTSKKRSDKNKLKLKDNRDYLTSSNIYTKLSDCQAACRLIQFLFYYLELNE